MSEVRSQLSAATAKAASGPLRADRERPNLPPLPRDDSLVNAEAVVARFKLELEKLTGIVHGPARAPVVVERVVGTLSELGVRTILGWDDAELACPGLAVGLRNAGITVISQTLAGDDERQAVLEELAQIPVGLTGALAGIADTGSIVVASGPGRARVASLLAPTHLAVLPVSRLHATLSDWLTSEQGAVVRDSANVVVITGPSRTADIELVISLGVHGPKEIQVFLYDDWHV